MRNNKQIVGYISTAAIPQAKKSDYINDSLSVNKQEKQIREYCRAKGYKLSKIFSDNGHSGASLKRPGIQSLLADVVAGKVSKVICLDLSRLTRNSLDFAVLKSLLEKNQVKVITITGANTLDTSESKFLEKLLKDINSFYCQVSTNRRNQKRMGK